MSARTALSFVGADGPIPAPRRHTNAWSARTALPFVRAETPIPGPRGQPSPSSARGHQWLVRADSPLRHPRGQMAASSVQNTMARTLGPFVRALQTPNPCDYMALTLTGSLLPPLSYCANHNSYSLSLTSSVRGATPRSSAQSFDITLSTGCARPTIPHISPCTPLKIKPAPRKHCFSEPKLSMTFAFSSLIPCFSCHSITT